MGARYRMDSLDSPLGRFAIVVDEEQRLCLAGWLDGNAAFERRLEAAEVVGAENPGGVSAAMTAYFGGDLGAIDDLAVATAGTAFQQLVWAALREIPAGETWSYGQLAAHIGRPTAVRAVGLANGRNPVGVVVPCHRVIGANGKLTGYGGGLERKQWLLAHERPAGRALSLF